jgi:S-adenosylmethionine:tRNA ribosyltransferase-isomerase
MHSEWLEVPAATWPAFADTRARGGRIVAVGTTTLRALESAARLQRHGRTGALLRRDRDLHHPGFKFKVVDVLVTNFHLPKARC